MRSIAFVLIVIPGAFLGFTAFFQKEYVWVMRKSHTEWGYPKIEPLWAIDYVMYFLIGVGLLLFVMSFFQKQHKPQKEKEIKLEHGEGADLVDFNASRDQGYETDVKTSLVGLADFNADKDSTGQSFVSFDDND